LWNFWVTSVAMGSQQCFMFLFLRHMYDEIMSPATIKGNRLSDILYDFIRM
jgi:hypothetical protein